MEIYNKKNKTLNVLLAIYFIILLFFRTNGPNRILIYSDYGLAMFFLFVIIMVLFNFNSFRKIEIKRTSYFLFFLCLLSLFNLLFVAELDNVIKQVNNFILHIFIILFMTIFTNIEKKNYEKLAKVFLYYSLISGIVAYLVYSQIWNGGIILNNRILITYDRLVGWYTSPNVLVDYLVIGLASSYYLYKEKQNKIYLLLFVFISAFIFLTGSRGGMFSIIFSIITTVIYAIIVFRSRQKVLLKFVLTVLFMLFIYILIKQNSILMYNIFRPDSFDSAGNRTFIWKDLMSVFIESNVQEILFGQGHNVSFNLLERSTHNSYLQIIIENGALVFISIVVFLLYSLILTFTVFKNINKFTNFKNEITFILLLNIYIIIRSAFQQGKLFSGDILWVIFLLNTLFIFEIKKHKEEDRLRSIENEII